MLPAECPASRKVRSLGVEAGCPPRHLPFVHPSN